MWIPINKVSLCIYLLFRTTYMVDYELIALPRSCTIPETSSASLRNTMIYNVSGYTTTVCIYKYIYIYRRVRVCIGAYSISFCARTHKFIYTHKTNITCIYKAISLHIITCVWDSSASLWESKTSNNGFDNSCSILQLVKYPRTSAKRRNQVYERSRSTTTTIMTC